MYLINTQSQAVTPMIELPFEWNKPLHTAAVCVYPSRVRDAVSTLHNIDKENMVKVASGEERDFF